MNVTTHLLYLKLAIVFLTRLPLKVEQEVQEHDINHTSAYFGMVGFGIAAIVVAVAWLFSLVLPNPIVVLLCMAASLLITGAFHEDGLADAADGFGGGWLQQDKLKIMKDSRIGTYGACALVLSLLLKYQLLLILLDHSFYYFAFGLLVAHCVSRVVAVSYIGDLPYVQIDGESKTKPVAQSLPEGSWSVLLLSLAVAFILLWLVLNLSLLQIGLFAAILFACRDVFRRFIQKQIQGYTGDVLGAAQQIFELSCYLILVAFIPSVVEVLG